MLTRSVNLAVWIFWLIIFADVDMHMSESMAAFLAINVKRLLIVSLLYQLKSHLFSCCVHALAVLALT